MEKQLVDSFRKDDRSKWKLYRSLDEKEEVWQVLTDRTVFSGGLGELDVFCKEHGIEFLIKENLVEEEILIEAIEITGELVVEAVSEPSEPIESEPELEVIAVLEEVTQEELNDAISLPPEPSKCCEKPEEPEPEVVEPGPGVAEAEELQLRVQLTKEAEIARLRAEIEALEK